MKSQKNHIQNHKITRKITYRKHQISLITEKLLKNHTKKSTEITKITKNHREKSCDFKITKITYAILRSDLPLGFTHEAFSHFRKAVVRHQLHADWPNHYFASEMRKKLNWQRNFCTENWRKFSAHEQTVFCKNSHFAKIFLSGNRALRKSFLLRPLRLVHFTPTRGKVNNLADFSIKPIKYQVNLKSLFTLLL